MGLHQLESGLSVAQLKLDECSFLVLVVAQEELTHLLEQHFIVHVLQVFQNALQFVE